MKESVAGIAFENNKLFIAKRIFGGSMGGRWEFAGGKCEVGETPIEALKREFAEEFAVEIEVGNFLGDAEFVNNNVVHHLSAYQIFFKNTEFKLSEHTGYCYASIDEISAMDFTPSDLALLPKIKAAIEKNLISPRA